MPAALADALLPLLSGGPEADEQRSAFEEVMTAMGRGGPPPEERAANSVLAFLRGEARLTHAKGPGVEPPGPRDRHIGKRG